MSIERRINQSNGIVELWKCQWENVEGQPARKTSLAKICDEQPINKDAEGGLKEQAAICWSYRQRRGLLGPFIRRCSRKRAYVGFARNDSSCPNLPFGADRLNGGKVLGLRIRNA